MADNPAFEDLVDYDHLALYDEKMKQLVSTKADDADVVKSVTVGGSAAPKANNTVSLGSAAEATVEAQGVDSDTTTLPTTAQVKSYVDDSIASAIVGTYKPSGSVAFANLPALAASVLGNVYNVTDSFTTTANFVEGAGKDYPAGTNVIIVDIDATGQAPTYRYDALSGIVDLSNYVQFSDITIVTNAQINALFSED